MKRRRILAIVEGHGEQLAVPLLLRRWLKHRRYDNFETPDLAIRAPGSGALKCAYEANEGLGIEYFVEIAAKEQPSGILILLDADDECLARERLPNRKALGPELLERARRTAPHIPIEVVIANREYEAWLLAAVPALQRAGKLPARLHASIDASEIEAVRDCKGRLSRLLGRPYEPSIDQRDFTEALPLSPAMAKRSRSFRKLLKALDCLTRAARRS